jgi:tRNA threonylcarbamoyladenosine biosynthesis protein TsaB
MRILALDTSTEWCSAAVGDGEQWLSREIHAGALHSEHLLPMVRSLLADAGLTLASLDGIAFGAGPGSFTGIRVGCGVAQGLAFGADLPVVGASTLEALAQEARRAHGWRRVFACLDARMREVYAAAYEAEAATWRAILEPTVAQPGALAPTNRAEGGAGDGFAAYPALAAQLGLAAVDAELRPTARAIGELALPRLAAGDGVPAAQALPTYVRQRVALTTAERDAGLRL